MEPLSPSYRLESPFPYYAVPRLFSWTQDFKRFLADDFAPKTLEDYLEHWGLIEQVQQSFGVWSGPTLGGMISLVPINPTLGQLHFLYTKGFWGSDITLASLQQVCDGYFSGGGRKLSSFVFADNARVITIAKRLGAKNEGFLRKHTLRGGEMCDLTALGLTDDDFYSVFTKPVPADVPVEVGV